MDKRRWSDSDDDRDGEKEQTNNKQRPGGEQYRPANEESHLTLTRDTKIISVSLSHHSFVPS